jgi:hypothetical protein
MPAGTRFLNDASLPRLFHVLSSQKDATCDHNRWENAATSKNSHMQSDSSKNAITCRGNLVDHKITQVVYTIEEFKEFANPLSLRSSDHWEKGPPVFGTSHQHKKVRRAINEERKRQQEIWVPWIAAAVGVIGALTGLILALTKG